MSSSLICRICAEFIFDDTAKKMFENEPDLMRHRIELLTGIWLEDLPDMPHHICTACCFDLEQAVAFRERCISTQVRLSTFDNRYKTNTFEAERHKASEGTYNYKESGSKTLTSEEGDVKYQRSLLEENVALREIAASYENKTQNVEKHQPRPVKDTPFTCKFCERSFAGQFWLQLHIDTEHDAARGDIYQNDTQCAHESILKMEPEHKKIKRSTFSERQRNVEEQNEIFQAKLDKVLQKIEELRIYFERR
ncbi:transcription factor Ouib-like isoform X2 [Scaptodrosophila lebanonensis]|uniref:Transcription factor Ouib-like isoform X2 n=1 Tax=Drosophila lebanonensis TaxID=7225 RepID=A0A6J2TN42_DROLE|nr:transcription factor Ouib-like isoform X2 [Scaptodrosophila lebanonensis]